MIFHNTKLINLGETEVSLFYLYCWLFFFLAERCRQPLATLRERLHLSARATLLLHFVLELARGRGVQRGCRDCGGVRQGNRRVFLRVRLLSFGFSSGLMR